jgi:hypothetical protein
VWSCACRRAKFVRGWPILRANFRALVVGICSQSGGPSLAEKIGPTLYNFRSPSAHAQISSLQLACTAVRVVVRAPMGAGAQWPAHGGHPEVLLQLDCLPSIVRMWPAMIARTGNRRKTEGGPATIILVPRIAMLQVYRGTKFSMVNCKSSRRVSLFL